VMVSDNASGHAGVGSYSLHFAKAVGANEGGLLPNGGEVSDAIELGDLDSYTFAAGVGESIQLRVADTMQTSFHPIVTLYGPDGAFITTKQGASVAAITRHNLPVAGIYTAVVGDNASGNSGVGDYTLHFTKAPGANEGGKVNYVGDVSGFIDLGDLDSFSFDATAGADISLVVTDTSGSAFHPIVTLYGPTGSHLTNAQGATMASISNYTVPSTGTYVLVIGDNSSGRSGVGSYNLGADVDGLDGCPGYICLRKGSWRYKLYQ
jgi:hypothetical protein